jgi:hypothetical protein
MTFKPLINTSKHKVGYTFDEVDNLHVVQTLYDVEPALKSAEIARDNAPGKDMRHIAEIPHDVLDRAFKEGWYNDQKAWRAWVNNSDNAKYRVHKG